VALYEQRREPEMMQVLHRVFNPQVAWLLLACPAAFSAVSAQQPAFAVATIRPSSAAVQFEHDGKTETTPGTLRMRDVSVQTCIKWAYGVQNSQITGPAWIDSEKFDITAKADAPATEEQMKLMLQTLLTDRFKLSFHHQSKELKAFVLTVAKGGAKVTPAAAPAAKPFHQNSANGSVVKSMTIREWGDYISGPLQMPVVDETGLAGKYDFVLDFTSYLPDAKNMGPDRPDTTSILMAAMEGELGIKMASGKTQVAVMVIDHVEKPTAN
jgi:uncharacterized protein (TIGR03435 family)